jgi:exodeoxyribonuclease V beta subunit
MYARAYKRPEILEKITANHAVIEASAGTGKTFTLEHLVLDLVVDKGIPLERILVVTFTEKAAKELRVRVRRLLEERVQSGGAKEAASEENTRIDAALRAFDAATIGTIHSYCQRALREIAFDAGRPFALELTTTAPLAAQAFRELFRTTFANDPVLEAPFADCGPLALAAELEGVRARGIPIAPTAEEIDAATLPEPAALRRAMTAARTAAGKRAPTKEAVAQVFEGLASATPSSPDAAIELWSRLSDAQRTLFDSIDDLLFGGAVGRALPYVAAKSDPRFMALTRMLPPIAARVAAVKQEEGFVDFDDLIGLVADALDPARGPAAASAAETLRARHDVALLDEFQDTDEKQWKIFETLFLRADKRLYLVGDPKQAIYRFRGGDLPTYLAAVARIEAMSGLAPIPLTVNFRSTAPLLEATNALLARDFFHGDNRYRHPVTAGRRERRLVDAAGSPLPPILVPTAEGPKKISSSAKRRKILAAVAEALRATVEHGFIDDERDPMQTRPLRWSDVFVLVASKTDGASVAKAFRRYGIPATRYKEEGLFQTAEAADLYDLLDSLAHPTDRNREIRAYQTLFFGCNADDLEALAALDEGHPLAELRSRLRALAGRGVAALVAELLAMTGARARLLLAEAGARRLVNLEHLLEVLAKEARSSDVEGAVRLLGTWVRGEASPPGGRDLVMRLSERGDAAQILTMHASKGLERPVVAIVSLGSKKPPSGPTTVYRSPTGRRQWIAKALPAAIEASVAKEEAEEAERVAYVALTRARHQTILPLWREEEAPPGEALKEIGKRYLPFARPLLAAIADRVPGISVLPAQHAPRIRPVVQGAAPTAPTAAPPTEVPEVLVFPTPTAPRLDREAVLRACRPRKAHSFTSLASRTSAELLVESRGDVDDAPPEAEEVQAFMPPLTLEDLPTPEAPVEGARPAVTRAGARWGDFVHQVLEATLASMSGLPGVNGDLAAFQEAFAAPLLPLAVAAGYDADALAEALPLAYAGLTAPLRAGENLVFSLRDVDPARTLPELEFHYALAEQLGESRDHLLGSIDVVLEHAGKIHLIDWKTNRLDRYDAAALEANVAEHYALQVAVYTLAAARLFGLTDEATFAERFGGVHYVYLRGALEGARPFATASEIAASGVARDGGPTSTRARPFATASEIAASGVARDGGPTSQGVYSTHPRYADLLRWQTELDARVSEATR